MEKTKIFAGGTRTGKTRVAKMIMNYLGEDKTVYLDWKIHLKNDVVKVLEFITHKTELVIIDDCTSDFIKMFLSLKDNIINLNYILITSDLNYKLYDLKSFTSTFEVI